MKRAVSITLALVLLLSLSISALAFDAQLSAQNLSVNGETVACEKYNIDGSNYFKLRDLAQLLNGTGSQFDVGWDADAGVVSITTNHAYTTPNGTELVVGADQSNTAQLSAQTIMIDGVVRTDLTVYNIGGSNFFKLREMGDALGFAVDYNGDTNTATVASSDVHPSEQKTMTEATAVSDVSWYDDSMYRVGIDIPAGDYYAVVTEDFFGYGYYCKYTDSYQKKIEANDNFSGWTFFRAYEGQYLELYGCKITPIEYAPVIEVDSDGQYKEGLYRVGIDMPAGEYKLSSTDPTISGYFCAYDDITQKHIVNNKLFDGTAYYTVASGQFFQIERCTAELIKAAEPVNAEPVKEEQEIDNQKIEIKISLDQSAISMTVGETKQVKATVTPTGTAITWSSGNNAIATVNSDGVITAVGEGVVDIYVTAGEQKAYCTVTVTPASKPLTSTYDYLVEFTKSNGNLSNNVYTYSLYENRDGFKVNLFHLVNLVYDDNTHELRFDDITRSTTDKFVMIDSETGAEITYLWEEYTYSLVCPKDMNDYTQYYIRKNDYTPAYSEGITDYKEENLKTKWKITKSGEKYDVEIIETDLDYDLVIGGMRIGAQAKEAATRTTKRSLTNISAALANKMNDVFAGAGKDRTAITNGLPDFIVYFLANTKW